MMKGPKPVKKHAPRPASRKKAQKGTKRSTDRRTTKKTPPKKSQPTRRPSLSTRGAKKIFLSHTHRDKKMVRRLAKDLQAAGVAVWLDEWRVDVGESVPMRVQAGLTESPFVGVWLTKNSVESPWVEKEWQTALHEELSDRRVRVLPLLGEDCEIPLLLKDKVYADFTQSYEQGLSELLDALKRPNRRTKKVRSGSPLVLDYFDMDPSCDAFFKREVTKEQYRGTKRYYEGNPDAPDIDRFFKPKTPMFKNAWFHGDGGPMPEPHSMWPKFLLTVFNGGARKLVLHTLALELFHILRYKAAADSGPLEPMAMYDIKVPRKPGTVQVPMDPQLAIAVGDVVSFHVRLLPRHGRLKPSFKNHFAEIRVLGSAGVKITTGPFGVDLLV